MGLGGSILGKDRGEALRDSLGTHLCLSMLALMNFRFFLLLLLSITLLFTILIDMPASVDEPWIFFTVHFSVLSLTFSDDQMRLYSYHD